MVDERGCEEGKRGRIGYREKIEALPDVAKPSVRRTLDDDKMRGVDSSKHIAFHTINFNASFASTWE